MSRIFLLLKRRGPCLSSNLADLLIAETGISADSARKMISRAVQSREISSMKGIFPKRESFVYCSEDFGGDHFWCALTGELIRSGSATGLALSALLARGGIMPVAHFAAASGAPLAMKKKLSAGAIRDILTGTGLCQLVQLPGVGECIALKERREGRYDDVAREVKARLKTEDVFIDALVQWARNLNFFSFDAVRTRSEEATEQPLISVYPFDITAPSYLSPLTTQAETGSRPGFFACDILLGASMTMEQVQPFIAKSKAIRAMKNVGRTLFVFGASHFEPDAFQALKQNGIVPATPENLFGKAVADCLAELNQFLSGLSSHREGDAEKIDSIMQSLKHVRGATAQLRGALFEYLVAETMRPQGGTVSVGRICRDGKGNKAESDVCVSKAYLEVCFIECKGYRPYSEIPHDIIRHWIGSQVPVFFAQGRADEPKADIQLELWTTGRLSAESREALDRFIENNSHRSRYTVRIREAWDVSKAFHETRNKALIDVYEKHFARDPRRDNDGPGVQTARRLAGGVRIPDAETDPDWQTG